MSYIMQYYGAYFSPPNNLVIIFKNDAFFIFAVLEVLGCFYLKNCISLAMGRIG